MSNKTIIIRITDATILGGAPVEVGSIHTVDEGEAVLVMGAGRAVRHVEPEPAAPAPTPEPVVETASIVPAAETASIPPAKHGKRRG